MARTVNPTVHAVRRAAFVDVAQRLIQANGYEQMSIQDVLDALHASRGAFYHYFDSKSAVLAAVVERMVDQSTAALEPVVRDPRLSAMEKLRQIFASVNQFKTDRRDLVLGMIRVWFSDDNVLVRDRLRRRTAERLTPLLAAIVDQARAERRLRTSAPEATARVLVQLWLGLNELAGELFLDRATDTVAIEDVERTFGAYLEAFERILGLPDGSLPLDVGVVREWFAEVSP